MAKKKKTQPGGLSRFQKFEVETIHRSKLQGAEYNPRTIDDNARQRLAKALQKHGLVSTLVWNRRTGTLVSGHQRLQILDTLEGTNDYTLTVAVVDVDAREEKQLNVQLNNPSMQGDWDIDKLALFKEDFEIDFDELGFSDVDIDFLFGGDERFSKLFEDDTKVRATKDILDDIKEDRSTFVKGLEEDQSADFYFMVVCESQEDKDNLLKQMGVPISEQFVTSAAVRRLVK